MDCSFKMMSNSTIDIPAMILCYIETNAIRQKVSKER